MIRFSEMPYERPDFEGLKTAVEEINRGLLTYEKPADTEEQE